MQLRTLVAGLALLASTETALADANIAAGRELVTQSCTTCHATNSAKTAADTAPPLSQIARDNKANKTWIHAWLSNPHRAMSGIMLSRQQIDDVMAYLNTLPTG